MTVKPYPQPLLFGRLLRAAAGVACLISIPFVPPFEYTALGVLALVAAGVTFIIASITANPGCEITALPNLFLPRQRQIHCFCPLFSPVDRLERALRARVSTQGAASQKVSE